MELVKDIGKLVVLLSLYYCYIALRSDKLKPFNSNFINLSLFILLGAIFDLLTIVSVTTNQKLFLILCYFILYPVYLTLGTLFNFGIKKHLLVQIAFVLLWWILAMNIEYHQADVFVKANLIVPIYGLHIIAIVAIAYRMLTKKMSGSLINIYYLLLGLICIESVALLSIYNLIQFRFLQWVSFKMGFILYIIFMRIIFMFYVSRATKS